VNVQGIEKQPFVRLSVSPSRHMVLVDEPFQITFRALLKQLPGRFDGADPISAAKPPKLDIPFFEVSAIPGLRTPDIQKILQKQLVNRNQAGFLINSYLLQPRGFFGFGDQEPARFMLKRKSVTENGTPYLEYTLTLSYSPKEEGSYTFGPVVFKGEIVTAVDKGQKISTRPIFAIGPATTVRVVPPPEAGRPLSFIGAVGTNLLAEATLDAQTCKVGDPLTLTLRVSGNVSLHNMYPPPLNAQEDLRKTFRIYEDTVDTSRKTGHTDFIYTIRPTVFGSIELPPLAVSYYNAIKRRYETVFTPAIPLQVRPTLQISETNIIGLASNAVPSMMWSRPGARVIAPVIVGTAGATSQRIAIRKWHVIVILAGPFAYIALIYIQSLIKHRRHAEIASRKKRALRQALGKLSSSDRTPENISRDICSAFIDYLAGRFDRPSGAITPSDAAELLRFTDVSAKRRDRFLSFYEIHFNTVYDTRQTLTTGTKDDIAQAQTILKELEKEIKS